MRRSRLLALVVAVPVALGCGRVASNSADGRSPPDGTDAGADATIAKRLCAFKDFSPAVTYATTHEADHLAVVDRTHTGHLDIVVGERTDEATPSEFLKNAGDGSFVLSAAYGATDNNVKNLVSADFDGDGKVDLASEANGQLGLDLGTKDGFAAELVTSPTPETDGQLAVGDYDRDGHVDLAFAGYDLVESSGPGLPAPEPAHQALSILFGTGHGAFGAPIAYGSALAPTSIASGDFDGDGYLDIAGLGATNGIGFTVVFNAGDGTFRGPVSVVAGNGFIADGLGIADFDGDGKDDVSTTTTLDPNLPTQKDVLEVWNGKDRLGFKGPTDDAIVRSPTVYRIVTGDFNGDTKPDLAMVIGQSVTGALLDPIPVLVFENLGNGTFAAPVTYTVSGEDSSAAVDVAAGDFNGDGVTDLAVATFGESMPYPVGVNVLLSVCE